MISKIVNILVKLKTIKVPDVVAAILAGILIGKSGLNLIDPSEAIEFISSLGFAFLMFLSGVEVDLHSIKSHNKSRTHYQNPFFICSLMFLMTVLLSFLLSSVFLSSQLSIDPLLLTAIFSTASLGIIRCLPYYI